jgi:hypothetical protein
MFAESCFAKAFDGSCFSRLERGMQLSVRGSFVALSAACLFACSHHGSQTIETQPAATTKVPSRFEKITGEVVRRNGEYRFKVVGEEPEKILRLTRSRDPKEFASEEIHLRKYYGKTLVVKGILYEDWFAKADVLGQWLRPGEPRGSTLVGPEPN